MCTGLSDGDLGEALGRKYVEMTFGETGKERTLTMVRALEKALQEDIQKLDWMTPGTKKKRSKSFTPSQIKLAFLKSGVIIHRWRSSRAMPWEIFPLQTVRIPPPDGAHRETRGQAGMVHDAAYRQCLLRSAEHNINFPAGILQPPFYDNNMDMAVISARSAQ